MSDRVSSTTHRYWGYDFPPELLVVPYSAATILTAYHSYKKAYTFTRVMSDVVKMYRVPGVNNPEVCEMIRALRHRALVMTVNSMGAAVAMDYFVPIPVCSRLLGVVAGLDGVMALALKFLEPRYCGNPKGKAKDDGEGDAVLEQIRAIVKGWNPQPAGVWGRYAVESQRRHWEPDHVESDGVGTALTFLAALGAVAASGAAAGASWTAETLMGAMSRVPAFGY